MYKAKLQETCQRRRWALPRYATVKEGAEHKPSFAASVYVNGLSFHSSSSARSARDAQNLAARLAFLHFSPPPPHLSTPEDEEQTKERKITTRAESEGQEAKPKASEFQSQYKNQLQNYTQWKNLDPPVYTGTREGPVHALHFKAIVSVGGSTFESPGFFRTSIEAECAAAKAALESLSADSLQEEDFSFYKMALQELARYEDLTTPVYSTIWCGSAHQPVFFSGVEIEGEMFYGKAGKTKKQAELKAARAAYNILNERFKNHSGSKIISSLSSELEKSIEDESHLVENLESSKEDMSEISADTASMNAMAERTSSPSTAILDSSSLEPTCVEILPPPPPVLSEAANSYLLGSRFRIYTYFPSDIAFPMCVTVLPVSDNKWVAVNLELLN